MGRLAEEHNLEEQEADEERIQEEQGIGAVRSVVDRLAEEPYGWWCG